MTKYNVRIILFIICCTCYVPLLAQKKQIIQPDKKLLPIIDKNLNEAVAQYQYFKTQIPADSLPRALDSNGKLVNSNSRWWCSGFYPGTLFYLYEYSKNQELYNEGLSKLKLLKKEQFTKSTHDLGFMMYCSFGNAQRLKPNDDFKQVLVNSAKSLSTRFNPVVGSIKSWNVKDSTHFLVIIDNMMNLELLFYATRVTGDSSFYKIAVTHANTTMKNHFRPDFSSFHVVDYDPLTGAVKKKRTQQGAADNSAWARGQGWALYGYTMMYRETKDKKYLTLANHIADYILNHPNLPEDKIPYWDFNAPNIPGALRDASAGALMASALIELAGYNDAGVASRYLKVAEQQITTLSSPLYRAQTGSNSGFLLKHSVGSLPANSEVDVPLSYADYYYVEALMRYKKLLQLN